MDLDRQAPLDRDRSTPLALVGVLAAGCRGSVLAFGRKKSHRLSTRTRPQSRLPRSRRSVLPTNSRSQRPYVLRRHPRMPRGRNRNIAGRNDSTGSQSVGSTGQRCSRPPFAGAGARATCGWLRPQAVCRRPRRPVRWPVSRGPRAWAESPSRAGFPQGRARRAHRRALTRSGSGGTLCPFPLRILRIATVTRSST